MGGRLIYFEGTYASTFSGNPEQTPRYDYNQIMYRFDLDDPRLTLPAPVYLTAGTRSVSFFALDRPQKGTLPLYAVRDDQGNLSLRVGKPADPGEGRNASPLCYAIRSDTPNPPAATVPLYEFVHTDGLRRAYSTDAAWSEPGFRRGREPLCRVWENPNPGVILP
jgi:hypothetical protein